MCIHVFISYTDKIHKSIGLTAYSTSGIANASHQEWLLKTTKRKLKGNYRLGRTIKGENAITVRGYKPGKR